MTFRKGQWSVSARAAVAAAVLGSASTVHAGNVWWAQPPVEGDPTPASYTDAINWADASGIPAVPGANDTALFDGIPDYTPIVLGTSVTHDAFKSLNGWPAVAATAYNAANPITITLNRADNLALQIGSSTASVGGAYAEFHNLHLNVANGGVTVATVQDPESPYFQGYLEIGRTRMTVNKDFVIGAGTAGEGYAYLHGQETANIGGNLLIGNNAYGSLDVFSGYVVNVAGDLRIRTAPGGTASLNVQNVDEETLPTGLNVAGDVHVGSASLGGTDGAYVDLYKHTFLHAGGDMILHAASDVYTATSVYLTASEGSARNLQIEALAQLVLYSGSRFDVRGGVTLKADSYLYIDADSVMTVAGAVSLERGAWLSVLGTLTGGVVNHGTTNIVDGGAAHVTTYTQADDAEMLVDIASSTDFGHLTVEQGATLDGVLRLEFGQEYIPTEGATFDILDAAQTIGTFKQVLVDAEGWYAAFNPSTGVVTLSQSEAVPEPTALLAVLPLAMMRRRRRMPR